MLISFSVSFLDGKVRYEIIDDDFVAAGVLAYGEASWHSLFSEYTKRGVYPTSYIAKVCAKAIMYRVQSCNNTYSSTYSIEHFAKWQHKHIISFFPNDYEQIIDIRNELLDKYRTLE